MTYIQLFEKFKENNKNTPILYSDENLIIKVSKTFDSSKELGKGTSWCSNNISGYYTHSSSSNMYRFIFKNGYKLRLTWDYISREASGDSFAGGTHWGQGGVVNGKMKHYLYLRIFNNNDPFYVDYKKNDDRQEMVNKIKSLPTDAIKSVIKYQEEHSSEKSSNYVNMYKEIEKISITNIQFKNKFESWCDFEIYFKYRDKRYVSELQIGLNHLKKLIYVIILDKKFSKEFKNLYVIHSDRNRDIMNQYLIDKSIEWSKNNNYSYLLDLIKSYKSIKKENLY